MPDESAHPGIDRGRRIDTLEADRHAALHHGATIGHREAGLAGAGDRERAEEPPRTEALHDAGFGPLRQQRARLEELDAATGTGEHGLHDAGPRLRERRGLRAAEPRRRGCRNARCGAHLDERPLVVQGQQRLVRHRCEPHARRQPAAQQRGEQDLLRHRQYEFDALLCDERHEFPQVGFPVSHRGAHGDTAGDRARGAGEVAGKGLCDDHAAARGVQRPGHLERLGQASQRQQHRRLRRSAHGRILGITRHMSCCAGRVVRRATGLTLCASITWKS